MAGLIEWEERSRAATKARIWRKRRDAISYYVGKFGRVPPIGFAQLVKKPGARRAWVKAGEHSPRRENLWGVLWHET